MAVRRKKAEGGDSSSLDSLMDALTNVVAVLIFVLLLVNCDVAQTVVKIMEDIVPVSEEEMRQAQEMLKQIDLDAKRLEELKKQPQPSKVEFEELQKALEALKKLKDEKLKKIEAHGGEIAELQKRHDEAQAARDAENTKNVAMQEEIRNLESLLDTTPVEKDIPATEITIPNTRPIPEGAKVYNVYVIYDRVHIFDHFKVEEEVNKFWDELKKDKSNHFTNEKSDSDEEDDGKKKTAAERRAEREKAKADAKTEKPVVLDRYKIWQKLTGSPPPHAPSEKPKFWNAALAPELQKKFNLPPEYAVGVCNPQNWAGFLRLGLGFMPDKGGTTIEELKQPSNAFASALSKLRPPNDVVIFQVHPQSMYAYALAREIVDKKGIPAGWNVTDLVEWRKDRQDLSIQPIDVLRIDPNAPKREARFDDGGTSIKLD
jgi:hypothetical protein